MRRLLYISLLLVLLSCEKDSSDPTLASGSFDISLEAQLPELTVVDNPTDDVDGATRASTQYTVRIKWAAGDKLSVINHTTGKILGGQLTADGNGTTTTFSGEVSGTVNKGDVISYLYPAETNTAEVEFEGVSIDMSAQRGTTGAVPLCVYSTVVADSPTFTHCSLSFSFVMSYVMIGLSDVPSSSTISRVTLTNVTNAFDLGNRSDGMGFTVTPHTGNIVLSPGSAASAAGVKTVYAAIPASAAMQRQVILETSVTSFTAPFTSAKLNNGYAYNTNVAGFLVDDLAIADDAMREYCLTHFDANGDGRLAMVEVAGVTSFPDQTQYPIPSEVMRFNELEYFYGLTTLPSFKNCNRLEAITIPQQIEAIPSEMFYGCTTLVKVILKPMAPPALGDDVFVGQAGDLIFVVADEAVDDYQTAEKWRDYFNNFRTESSQNNSNVEIDTEDEGSMDNERVDVIVG